MKSKVRREAVKTENGNKSKSGAFFDVAAIIIGELAVSLAVCAVYLIIGRFGYRTVTGVLLGSAVTVLNFLLLSASAGRAIDKALEERGDGEMDDGAAAEFAAKHRAGVQAAIKISYVVRSLSMVGALVLAFLLDGVFDVIATLIPLLMLRPILTVSQLIKSTKNSKEEP